MFNLEQLIADAESLVSQINAKSEQEKAMQSVLPLRFSANIEAFSKYIPSIVARFDNYQPGRPFEFFCSDNGIPNLRWKDNDVVFYPEDPYAYCREQIRDILSRSSINRFVFDEEHDPFGQKHVLLMNELVRKQKELKEKYEPLHSIPESMPLGFMFGVGLGYQLGYLYEQCQVANLFIFEPDEDLFYASLFTFDWAPLLDYLNAENMGLHLFVGDSGDDIIKVLRDVLEKRSPFLCSSTFGWIHYRSDVISALVERISRNLNVAGIGWGFFDDNLFSIAHSFNNLCAGVPFFLQAIDLPERWKNVPVFIIANGPSLDSDIELVRRYQNKAIVVACGTAITALHRTGIKPDIYVAVERVSVVPDSLKTLKDPDYLRDVILLGPDILHPDCRELFDKKIYIFKADEPMFSLLYACTDIMDEYRSVSHINPLVGNCGVSLLLHLGFENMYFLGLDNGYRSAEHHHSRLSMYYDHKGEARDEFREMALAQGNSILPGNFGGDVISNQLFSASVMMLETVIKNFPSARCINCSDGAALRGTLSYKLSDITFEQYPLLNKDEIKEFLLNDMSSPLQVDLTLLSDAMDYSFFDMLIEKISQEWGSIPTGRFALIQMMQRQMDYLYQVSMSRQRHIGVVLFGTINSMFTVVSHLAYSIKNEQEAMAAVSKLQPTISLFFDMMKKLYPHAFEMIQGKHMQWID